MKNITEAVNWRYSTKRFNPSKKISKEDFSHIENILLLSPTSTNLQPLHFIIADDEAGKNRIAKAASEQPFSANKNKILNASHVIVFCSKTEIDDKHLNDVIAQEDKDGRFVRPELTKEIMDNARRAYLNIHRSILKDEAVWHSKQSYIAFGEVLLGAAMLGIDATPIEGVDINILNEEFNLIEKGYTAHTVITLGYRDENDFNATLPKSRLPKSQIISKA
ncbi:dihydropteridine reductase [Bisgaardia hudsonensis]|uniref:Dihydropteridine reductase n=1 Tax=Bisgaardia hudsonensis TaxID=109472 RepID=A0A4R2N1D1_9PAST|nr:oxygen-insensitive NAD(P)H nitroreductase [Bisgaardia hudsonensis]QLB13095.1 NAD(P)H nitroreductase [Bisgaardia hudsonensis]TCP13338.1 dihydropteridine reductase [Bisgaardia hudsonensis]